MIKKPEPVEYIPRTRDYYAAQGFDKPYRWAQNDTIPWQVFSKPLREATVTFITTAVPDSTIPKLSRTASSHSISSFPDLSTDELSWDKETTHTRDVGSYLPLKPLADLAAQGFIGSLTKRFHFVPTEYSQKITNEVDAPQILKACLEDGVDIAVLVPL